MKGTKSGLLLHLHERPLVAVAAKLRERMTALPNFYRGGRAVLMLGDEPLESRELEGMIATLEEFGITADGAVCDTPEVIEAAREAGLRIVAASVAAAPRVHDDRVEPAEVRKAWHEGGEPAARAAARRLAGENGATGRGIDDVSSGSGGARTSAQNCYWKGTLRSGQSLSAFGSIVVIGDVNAGAELIATGDILVWGTLRGLAHAGAEGDDQSAVFALCLEATQVRIARLIASAHEQEPQRARAVPEAARVREGRIVIEPAVRSPRAHGSA
ncbi:MAG: septum site-determining protein MinC [Candidatus Eremiobacter antarcticus]|nr:MAG: septum site-determining protein MinC [Candidatus Eremiobacter sp. RRmetagenome_bin22]